MPRIVSCSWTGISADLLEAPAVSACAGISMWNLSAPLDRSCSRRTVVCDNPLAAASSYPARPSLASTRSSAWSCPPSEMSVFCGAAGRASRARRGRGGARGGAVSPSPSTGRGSGAALLPVDEVEAGWRACLLTGCGGVRAHPHIREFGGGDAGGGGWRAIACQPIRDYRLLWDDYGCRDGETDRTGGGRQPGASRDPRT